MQSAKLLNLNIAREKIRAGSAMPLLLDHRRSCIGKPTIVKNSSRLSALVTVLRRRLATKKSLKCQDLNFKFIHSAEDLCSPLNPWNLQAHFKKVNNASEGYAHAFNPR